jgi:small-conductance mechanosensitive channel
VLAPISYSRLETALNSPLGLADLAVVVFCVGVAWIIDTQLRARSIAGDPRLARLHGGVARIVFALTALLLLFIGRFAFRRWGGVPLFIDLAIPLLVALAAIRMIVYAMRRLFANQAWLKASERAIGFSIWGLVILYFVGVLPEIAQALDDLTLPIGKTSISVLTIGKGIGAIVVTLIVALWLSGMLEQRLLGATSLDINTKAILAKFVRAVLLIVGILFALDAIGFDLTLLTVFGGALGVGIGLGLQKLAANYIAGFTILIDKSIRLGDLITVDNRFGVVSRVTSRYVVVRAQDGVEAIVPNETLVTTSVLHHPHPSHDIRLVIPIQVAYDADVALALRLMEEAARAEPSALKDDKAPVAQLVQFTDNGIQLELIFWVRDPKQGHGVAKSMVSQRVLDAFRQSKVNIAYPRREVRVTRESPSEPGTSADVQSPGVAPT